MTDSEDEKEDEDKETVSEHQPTIAEKQVQTERESTTFSLEQLLQKELNGAEAEEKPFFTTKEQ